MADQKLSALSLVPGVLLPTDKIYLVRSNGDSPETFESYQASIDDLLAGGGAGTDYEESVRIATDATEGNITLSGEQTIQGVVLVTGDRVLLTAQTDGGDNIVWVVDSGAWSIADGWDGASSPPDTVTSGKIIPVEEGDNAGAIAQLLTADPITLGVTDLVWQIGNTVFISNFTGRNVNPAAQTLNTSFAKNWVFATRNGAQTFAVPTHASQPHAIGTEIVIQAFGTGTKTITGGTGVTINGVSAGSVALSVQYDAYILKKKANNVWTATPWKAPGTGVTAGKHTIFIPASAMLAAATSGAATGQVEMATNKQNIAVLDFDDAADEYAHFQIAFPKSWNLGTVSFQVFWTTSATGTTGVAWALEAVARSDNEAIDAAWGTAVVVTDDAQSAANEQLVTAESGAVTIAGTPVDDDLVYFRLFRDVSDGNDDMTEDARLVGIKLFYTTDADNDA